MLIFDQLLIAFILLGLCIGFYLSVKVVIGWYKHGFSTMHDSLRNDDDFSK